MSVEKNTPGVNLPYEEVLKAPEYYAKLFAEHFKELEDLLLLCFEKEIWTTSCCSGHGYDKPMYIAFSVNNNDESLIRMLIDAFYNLKGAIIDINKSYQSFDVNLSIKTYWFYIVDGIINSISDILKTDKKDGVEKEDIAYIITFLNSVYYPFYDIRVETNNNLNPRRYILSADLTLDDDGSKQLYAVNKELSFIDLPYLDEIFANEVNKNSVKKLH